YEAIEDRESAYELLQRRAEAATQAAEMEKIQAAEAKAAAERQQQWEKQAAAQAREAARLAKEREKLLLDLAEGAAQALGGRQGKKIVRGVMGGILGYGTGRRR
ncbi:MAG TPA: DUF853 family protein, partial [Leptolyngbyaceae cyanobacterium M65_K2018_010]|nr:DUF853 family protein [Leptolyngbyaceae cyanobacterium M65_K2018_010]